MENERESIANRLRRAREERWVREHPYSCDAAEDRKRLESPQTAYEFVLRAIREGSLSKISPHVVVGVLALLSELSTENFDIVPARWGWSGPEARERLSELTKALKGKSRSGLRSFRQTMLRLADRIGADDEYKPAGFQSREEWYASLYLNGNGDKAWIANQLFKQWGKHGLDREFCVAIAQRDVVPIGRRVVDEGGAQSRAKIRRLLGLTDREKRAARQRHRLKPEPRAANTPGRRKRKAKKR